MATKTKRLVEVLLVSCEMTGVPEKGLLKSRNLGSVDLVWPRAGVPKKSAAREFVFKKGKVDFMDEPWAKRVLFREEVEGHTAFAVSVTEPVSVQKVRKFLRLTAKLAIKQGADFVEKAMLGFGDLASSPIDALAMMVGENDAPKIIAQGVFDLETLPAEGEEVLVTIPLFRPKLLKGQTGSLTLAVRG